LKDNPILKTMFEDTYKKFEITGERETLSLVIFYQNLIEANNRFVLFKDKKKEYQKAIPALRKAEEKLEKLIPLKDEDTLFSDTFRGLSDIASHFEYQIELIDSYLSLYDNSYKGPISYYVYLLCELFKDKNDNRDLVAVRDYILFQKRYCPVLEELYSNIYDTNDFDEVVAQKDMLQKSADRAMTYKHLKIAEIFQNGWSKDILD
jgi:hypothetical protein